MPERPPVPPRVAQPPGKTYLQFSPDGQRMLVAGCADYARSFKTNDDGEPDMIDHVQEDTLAIACGVSTQIDLALLYANIVRMTTRY